MCESHWSEWSCMHKKDNSRVASRILVLDSEGYRSDCQTVDLHNFPSLLFFFLYLRMHLYIWPISYLLQAFIPRRAPPCYKCICVPVRIVIYKVIEPPSWVLRWTDRLLNSIQQYSLLNRTSKMIMSELAKALSTSCYRSTINFLNCSTQKVDLRSWFPFLNWLLLRLIAHYPLLLYCENSIHLLPLWVRRGIIWINILLF